MAHSEQIGKDKPIMLNGLSDNKFNWMIKHRAIKGENMRPEQIAEGYGIYGLSFCPRLPL